MKNFLKLYAESEELLYKMCNDKNDPIRPKAINKDFHGLTHLVSSMWRNGIAAPSGKKILEQIKNDTLKVSYKKFGRLRMFASKYKLNERRYHGLNLTNIGNSKKNTIEFRMANGTLNPEVIKQNVFLYASLIDTSIKMTNNPEKYSELNSRFFDTNVTEEQKAVNFLNLIMKDPQDRQIYLERWQSVKNADVFKTSSKKSFSQNRFQRDEFKNVAQRTPAPMVQKAFNKIKTILSQSRDTQSKDKGADELDR